ncbi:MAG TPA: FAD-dependent oxidoreductase [Candidatus Limnocylindria bacterium]|nr:FAD-dependent oxidoreductase [Candidatus Limnocylindria bacterium]
MTLRHFDVLLIGGGVAAARCARTLRRRRHEGTILLVGEEPTLPYNRPPLSKELLRDGAPDDLVLAEPESWYERQAVELLTGRRVTALDTGARIAALDTGERVAFGRCLLATGGEPRRPPIPGAEGAFLLRTLRDARAISRRALEIGPGGRAVVIGGGFIGVEVSASLAALGLGVTMVELAPQPWGGALGEVVGDWATENLRRAGVHVRLGQRVTRLAEGEAWIGDERLPAGLVVAGVGVTPRTELASAAGIACDDGVVADASHRTSASSVFAAGDVARLPHPLDRSGRGIRVEHWHAAREGGEAAALAMLGEPPREPRAPWVFSEFAGATLDVVGWATAWDEEVVLGDLRSGRFALAYLADGQVAQVAITNAAIPIEAARTVVERSRTAAELGALFVG